MKDKSGLTDPINLSTDGLVFSESEMPNLGEGGVMLCQSVPWKKKQYAFKLMNDHQLFVRVSDVGLTKKYIVDIRYLDAQPRIRLCIAWRWLVCAVVLFSAAYFSDRLPIISEYGQHVRAVVGGMIVFGMLSSILLFRRTYTLVNYLTQYGRVPIVSMLKNRPGKNQYQVFMSFFTTTLARAKQGIEESEMLAAALAEHRRLRTEKIISESDYQKAKEKIFRLHSSGKASGNSEYSKLVLQTNNKLFQKTSKSKLINDREN